MIKTKIVATVGPACDSEAMIARMIAAGVNVFRLNFSHGTLASHGQALEHIRRQADEHNEVVAVMGDLCGPKIRVDPIAGGRCLLESGRDMVFQRDTILGSAERLSTSYPQLIDDVHVGHRVLIDDGNVRLRVTRVNDDEILCRCEVGGIVQDRKGINLPDTNVSSPPLTDKDRGDLAWAIEQGLDYVALSFVRRPQDLVDLRTIISDSGSPIRIVSKIERPEAVEHLQGVIDASDVVLVARGDLGVEMDVARVPMIQKEIALLCRKSAKPVIIATQMLQSMVEAPVPTRAEVSDVANAILDHADAVMLSAETSVGQHPLEAVAMLREVAARTEAFADRYTEELGRAESEHPCVTTAVAHGASRVAKDLNTTLVAAWTEHGNTPTILSKYRIGQPIVGLAADNTVCRQMAMIYGVIPVRLPAQPTFRHMLIEVEKVLFARGLVADGDRIVVTGDSRPDRPGETDALAIHEIGSAGGL